MTKLVLLVDDNRQMRQALRMLFESEPDFEVAGEASEGADIVMVIVHFVRSRPAI